MRRRRGRGGRGAPGDDEGTAGGGRRGGPRGAGAPRDCGAAGPAAAAAIAGASASVAKTVVRETAATIRQGMAEKTNRQAGAPSSGPSGTGPSGTGSDAQA